MTTGPAPSAYRIEITPAVARHMRKMPRDVLRRIDTAIIALARSPRPPVKKLRAQDDRYRIRVGDYRVIYEVDDAQLLILIVEVGHRKDVHRP